MILLANYSTFVSINSIIRRVARVSRPFKAIQPIDGKGAEHDFPDRIGRL